MKDYFYSILLIFFALPLSAKVKVAVIDTGVDINHKELRPYLWENPGETGLDSKGRDKQTNGIDDDLNGFIDDVHGFNFSENNSKVSDTHGHGTHISGLIAQNNRPEDIQLITLKYYNPGATGAENLRALVESFEYAIQMGAQIINMSGGGNTFSQEEWAALKRAEQKGILICAASGNKGASLSEEPFYPASYPLKNIISAASTDLSNRLLASSNFGLNVDFAALGYQQMSALPSNKQGPMTGTSQATANLCGAIAGLVAKTKSQDLRAIREHLAATGVYSKELAQKTRSGVRVHPKRALYMRSMEVDAFGQTDPVFEATRFSPRVPAGAGSF